jgi:hypothetical protein
VEPETLITFAVTKSTNSMKVIKIDSANRTITQIELEKGLQPIYDAIGNECSCFSCPVELDNGDTVYADDEGLFHPFEGGVMMADWAYPIVGNILIIGTDENGESVDVNVTIEEITPLIQWVDKARCEKWAANFL